MNLQILNNIPAYKHDYLVFIPTIIFNCSRNKLNNTCLEKWEHIDIIILFLKWSFGIRFYYRSSK
jgi:hypothetical protein